MARIDRTAITALVFDASKASAGAAEFERAAAKVKTANSGTERSAQRLVVMLGEQAKGLDSLRRAIDPTFASTQKLLKGQERLNNAFKGGTDLPEYTRLLGLLRDKYDLTTIAAAKAAEEQAAALERLRAKFTPLYAETRKYQEAVKDLAEAERLGVLVGADLAAEQARIDATLSPAAIAAKKAAEETAKLAREQEKAAESAARMASANENLRAKFDPAYASARKYKDALAELYEAATTAGLGEADFRRELERIESTLSPTALAAKKLALEQAGLAHSQAIAASEAADHARQLGNLKAKYDPAFAASRRYQDAIDDLNNAQAQGVVVGKAYQAALDKIERELNPVSIATMEAAAAQEKLADRARRLAETVNPLIRAERLYAAAVAEANDLARLGAITELQKTQALRHAADAYDEARQAADDYTRSQRDSERLLARRITQLSPQISDITTQALSGTPITQILVQQGPQIADIFGGIPTLIKKIPPVVGVMAASFVAAGAAAFVVGARIAEIGEQARRLESIGRTLNPQLAGMAENLRAVTMQTAARGASRDDAMAAVQQLAKIRTLQAELIAGLGPLSVDVAAVLGKTVGEAATQVGEAFSRGSAGVLELNDSLHFLNPEQARAVELLDRQGNRAQALQLALKALSETYGDEAKKMKSAWGQAMQDMINAWNALIEKISSNEKIVALIQTIGEALKWVTAKLPGAGTAADTVASLDAEIGAVEKSLDAAWQMYDRLQQMREQNAGITEDGVLQALANIEKLETKLSDLKRQRDAAQAGTPGAIGEALGANPPPRDTRGLTDDQATRVDKARRAFERETEAMAGNALQRRVTLAGLEAFNQALARGDEEIEARQYKLLAMEQAERDIAIAIRDENDLLDLNIEKTRDSARAYAESVASGLRADAARQAAVDQYQTGADPKARAKRLLDQRAADAWTQANQQFGGMEIESGLSGDIATGASGGYAGERAARRRAEAESAYRDKMSAATAANDNVMIENLRELQTRYEGLLKVRDDFDDQTMRSIALFEANRQTIMDTVDILNGGFEDLVFNGNSFIDVVRNMSQAFLRLGQDILVVEPLKRWMNETINTSSGGTGIWSMLSGLGSAAMNMWSGGAASAMPNAITDAGAMSATDLLANWKTVPVAHEGWHVGAEKPPALRTVPASVFVSAPRLHAGGMGPGEFGAILQSGEEVLTARDPRHRRNFQRTSPTVVMNITTQDASSFRQSQGQITAAAGRAISLASRRNG